jgi:hypothetical protein
MYKDLGPYLCGVYKFTNLYSVQHSDRGLYFSLSDKLECEHASKGPTDWWKQLRISNFVVGLF